MQKEAMDLGIKFLERISRDSLTGDLRASYDDSMLGYLRDFIIDDTNTEKLAELHDKIRDFYSRHNPLRDLEPSLAESLTGLERTYSWIPLYTVHVPFNFYEGAVPKEGVDGYRLKIRIPNLSGIPESEGLDYKINGISIYSDWDFVSRNSRLDFISVQTPLFGAGEEHKFNAAIDDAVSVANAIYRKEASLSDGKYN